MSSTFELLALHSVGRCAPSRLAFGSVCAFAFCAVMLPGRFVRSFWLWLLRVLFWSFLKNEGRGGGISSAASPHRKVSPNSFLCLSLFRSFFFSFFHFTPFLHCFVSFFLIFFVTATHLYPHFFECPFFCFYLCVCVIQFFRYFFSQLHSLYRAAVFISLLLLISLCCFCLFWSILRRRHRPLVPLESLFPLRFFYCERDDF